MKKLTFSLSEQYICYAAEYMSNQTAMMYVDTYKPLMNLLSSGNYQPGDLLPVTIDPDSLLQLHAALGVRSEFQTSAIHTAIKQQLFAELTRITNGEDAEEAASAGHVLQVLQQRSADAEQSIQDKIVTGRNFLKS